MTLLLKTLQHHQATLPSIFFSFNRKVGSKDFFLYLTRIIWKNASWKVGMAFLSFCPRTDKGWGEGERPHPLRFF